MEWNAFSNGSFQLTIAETALTSFQWHFQRVIKHKIKTIKGLIVGTFLLVVISNEVLIV